MFTFAFMHYPYLVRTFWHAIPTSFYIFNVFKSCVTLYSNSTKKAARKVSPRRLTVCEIRLDLVAWSVENHLGFG